MISKPKAVQAKAVQANAKPGIASTTDAKNKAHAALAQQMMAKKQAAVAPTKPVGSPGAKSKLDSAMAKTKANQAAFAARNPGARAPSAPVGGTGPSASDIAAKAKAKAKPPAAAAPHKPPPTSGPYGSYPAGYKAMKKGGGIESRGKTKGRRA